MDYLVIEQFGAMFSNVYAETIYYARNGFGRDERLCARAWRWVYWGGHTAVLQNDDKRYLYTLFERCVKYTVRRYG